MYVTWFECKIKLVIFKYNLKEMWLKCLHAVVSQGAINYKMIEVEAKKCSFC